MVATNSHLWTWCTIVLRTIFFYQCSCFKHSLVLIKSECPPNPALCQCWHYSQDKWKKCLVHAHCAQIPRDFWKIGSCAKSAADYSQVKGACHWSHPVQWQGTMKGLSSSPAEIIMHASISAQYCGMWWYLSLQNSLNKTMNTIVLLFLTLNPPNYISQKV